MGVGGWMDLWVGGWVYMHMNREMHRWMNRYVKDERKDGLQMGGWMDAQVEWKMTTSCVKGNID